MTKNKAKIILWDIESTNLSGNFGYILCIGWKFLGEKKTNLISIADFPLFDKDPTNDKMVVKEAAKVLSEADMWVTHYGQRFDVPFVNARLLYHKLDPLPPIPHVDTWRIARYKMKLNSNRLATIAAFFGLEEKTPLSGPIWIKAMAGHISAIRYVERHCKQDVVVLEQVYEKIKSLTTTHPNVNLVEGKKDSCPICGEHKLQKRGFTFARTRKYQRYSCTACGGWSRSSKCVKDVVLDVR